MKRSSLATLSTGVRPIASTSRSAVGNAASDFTARTTRSTPRDGALVRGAARAHLGTLCGGALGVARADHDVFAGLDETLREREPEVARATDDGDLHAGTAPSAASARRRRASASDISVRVTIGRTSPRPSSEPASASSTTRASIRPG